MPGFSRPSVMFPGNSYAPERRLYRSILGKLRDRGYQRLVEPYGGSFVVSLIARDLGWKVSEIEASDVGFFPTVLGTYLAGRDLNELGLVVDGEPIVLEGPPDVQAAAALWWQLRLRMEAKPEVLYWQQIAEEVRHGQERMIGQLAAQVRGLGERLQGIGYTAMDGGQHLAEIAADPHAVAVAAPPTYANGFERFYDTHGRLVWNEPDYPIFDPADGCTQIMEQMADAPALLLLYQEAKPGSGAAKQAVFARPGPSGKNAYVRSNRPQEVFEITGGMRVDPLYRSDIKKGPWPILPADHEITEKSKIVLTTVEAPIAEFYRKAWVHRLSPVAYGNNYLILIDGYAAAAFAYDTGMVTGFFGLSYPALMLIYCLSARHSLRLSRLAIMCALQRSTPMSGPANTSLHFHTAAAQGVVTMNFTRYPEAKQMRGLMRLTDRKPHPDGYKLIYTADWAEPKKLPQLFREWVAGERRYAKERAKAKAKEAVDA